MIEKLSDLGQLFRQFREHRQLTQEQLVERCAPETNRTQVALLEQGRRVPKLNILRAISRELDIPSTVWEPFAREESHERQQFEAIFSELVGRVIALRAVHVESIQAAEKTIEALFSGDLTASQAFDTLNSVIVFYAAPRMSRQFFDRYFEDATAFQSIEAFEKSVKRFQTEAIRLFSTFAEAYRRLNEAADLDVMLAPLKPRSLKAYGERTVWEHADPAHAIVDRISPLAEEKLEFLGYISAAQYRAQRRKRETLARLLRDLAESIRRDGAQTVEAMSEKRRRKLDSLLRELGSTLAHTPISPLFAPNPADLESEANRILRDEKDEQEMEKTQSQALSNLTHYISADYMDVYVATSMRTRSDFVSVNRFVQNLFRHEQISPLRLRYFNPTQSWIDDRVAKGLVEALMLRRASVTLYLAQKSDSFGKDSEASVALGQGKPVIVYVPKLYLSAADLDSEKLMAETDARLREILMASGSADEDLDELDHDGLFSAALTVRLRGASDVQLIEIVRSHWPDFALLEESERIRGGKDKDKDKDKEESARREAYTRLIEGVIANKYSGSLEKTLREDLVQILVAVTVNFEKRARLFREVHPLALQVILSSGVLNGILVSRSVDSCGRLLHGLLENKLELKLEPDADNYRLIEKTTQSTIRVISRNSLLSNALEGLYQRL